ncbi:glycine--tRNA ligase subunit alpha [Candidatus Vidania fulgoroideorum]
MNSNLSFYLKRFWRKLGFKKLLSYDSQTEVAIFNKNIIFDVIKKKKFKNFFFQKCRRPNDLIFFSNFNNLYLHNQFKVFIKPAKKKYIKYFLKSLKKIGFDSGFLFDFKKDNFNNISIGSFGKGWEIRINFLEIAQIIFFDRIMNKKLDESILEITYFYDRICYLLGIKKYNYKKSISYNSYRNTLNNSIHILLYFLNINLVFSLKNKIKHTSYYLLLSMINQYNSLLLFNSYNKFLFLNYFKNISKFIFKLIDNE